MPHVITIDQKKDIVLPVPNGTNIPASRSQTPEPELLPVSINPVEKKQNKSLSSAMDKIN